VSSYNDIPGGIIRDVLATGAKTCCFRGYTNSEGQVEYKVVVHAIRGGAWDNTEWISTDWLELQDLAAAYIKRAKKSSVVEATAEDLV